jgi:aspartate-semialdehyde dehydrogenase
MKKQGYKVAVVGATGAVGNVMISLLESWSFPVDEIVLLASGRSIRKDNTVQG